MLLSYVESSGGEGGRGEYSLCQKNCGGAKPLLFTF